MPKPLETFLDERRLQVEAYLRKHFSSYEPSESLRRAMNYSLEAGGKRLRPILTLATCEALGRPSATALPYACAIECIHTYSLIHDDLPAMDNDDLRRGKPTNHKVFGEATAILAGDGLLTEAFALLAADHGDALNPEIRLQIIARIADAAGGHGMVAGQLFDMEYEGKNFDLTTLKKIHNFKTGRLLAVAVEVGALVAGAPTTEVTALAKYGEHLGLAFQIIDDVLNVTSSASLGKMANSDSDRGKATFVALMGVDGSKKEAELQIASALKVIAPLGQRGEMLAKLAQFVIDRQK